MPSRRQSVTFRDRPVSVRSRASDAEGRQPMTQGQTSAPSLLGLEDDGRDLFGLAAHKLNTPIAALRGFIATLLQRGDQLDPETVRQFHTVMLAQTDKLQSMVRDFL